MFSSVQTIETSDATDFRRLWPVKIAALVALILVDAAWIAATDFRFDGASALQLVGISFALICVGWFYRTKRPTPRFEAMCVETALLLAFSAAAAVFSYLVTSLNFPLIDGWLLGVDGLLGFDWLAYVGYVNERPWLGQLSSIVYATTLSQVALTVIFLGLSGRLARTGQFTSAVMISSIICVLVSGILPSAGALGTIRPPVDFVHASSPIVDLAYKQTFFDLRSGVERFISLDHVRGLVAFPSYHCTLSALVVLAFVGVRFWFWPIAALNFAVIMSTPVDGGHHLSDILGGLAVAVLCWWLAAPRRAGSPFEPERAPKPTA